MVASGALYKLPREGPDIAFGAVHKDMVAGVAKGHCQKIRVGIG